MAVKKISNIRIAIGVAILIVGFLIAKQVDKEDYKYYQEIKLLMGTEVGVGVAGLEDEEQAKVAVRAAHAAMQAVHDEMGLYEGTALWELNKAGGGKISPAMAEVIGRALWVAEITEGAFDPTVAPLVELWDVKGENRKPPEAEEIEKALERVGWQRVTLDRENLTVDLGGTELALGAIAKGYAVDKGVEALTANGAENYIINAGGDIALKGVNNIEPWKVGLQDPRKDTLYKILKPDDGAIVTSGDYQSYFEHEGVRYHHILNPRTGIPAMGVASVTVWAENAMDADALATAAFVLGSEAGVVFLEALPGVEGLIMLEDKRSTRTTNFNSVTKW